MVMYNPANETRLTLPELASLPVPDAQGPRHFVYPFSDYANLVVDNLSANGLVPANAEFAVSKDNMRMFGTIEVRSERTDLSWVVGLRGSYDQSVSRGLVVGESVMVCSNLCFWGEVKVETKQTTFIARRIPDLVERIAARLPASFEREERLIDRMKDREIKLSAGDALLARVFRNGGLTSAQLGRALEEWDTPSYPEHLADGRNAWASRA